MMTTHITCKNCGSGINIYPSLDAKIAICDICQEKHEVNFNEDHLNSKIKDCPCCARKDFYSQKDFNRAIGVGLFIFAALISTVMLWKGMGPQYYLSTFIILYFFDFLLFRKLNQVVVCYNCQTIFRNVKNLSEIHPFNHEMNDRIVYSGHDFKGEQLEH